MQNTIFVATANNYSVPLTAFKATATEQKITILVLPALGIAAKFYIPLAEQLAAQGINAVLFEQRGYGDSALRPSRAVDYGFKEWLEEDLPATITWINDNIGGEICILGHSLGGHIGACYAAMHPSLITKLILSAVGTPWVGAFKAKLAMQIRVLSFLIPIVNRVSGSYNGKRFGFGGHEAATLMMDWRVMAQQNKYSATGMSVDFDRLIGEYQGQVLSLRYSEDNLAPVKPVELVLAKFKQAVVERQLLDSSQIGEQADHFNWVRKPTAITELISEWLQ